MTEIEKEKLSLISEMRKGGATDQGDSLTVKELVLKITGYNIHSSPLLFGLKYNQVSSELRELERSRIVKTINKDGKDHFYLTKSGIKYLNR
ncbi:MAG: hypothetical protein PVH79_00125 [Candidatus Bathyarchaeota archaeon]|jgi:hypothetical protein